MKRFLEIGEKFKIDGLLSEDEISEKENSSGDINTDLIKPEVNINGEEDVFLDYTSKLDNSNTDVYAKNDFLAYWTPLDAIEDAPREREYPLLFIAFKKKFYITIS